MEFTKKEDLKNLPDNLLMREADILIQFINQAREKLVEIKEIADQREKVSGVSLYEGDVLMLSDRKLLIQAVQLLVNLDNVVEREMPEYYSSAQLIAEVGDFYKIIENDIELAKEIHD